MSCFALSSSPRPSRLLTRPLLLSVLLAHAFSAQAIEKPATHMIGVQSEIGGSAYIDSSFALYQKTDRAALLSLWAGHHQGGLKLSWNSLYHDNQDNPLGVRKLFVAYDRAKDGHAKITLGGGLEKEAGFLGAYYAHRVSSVDKQVNVSQHTSVTESREGAYRHIDTTVTTITTTHEQRAFDHGLGIRAGHYFANGRILFSGGADYEWGKAKARQTTLSAELEAQLGHTPMSLALRGEVLRHRDPHAGRSHDERLWLILRYRFGQVPTRVTRNAALSDTHHATTTATTTASAVTPAQPQVRTIHVEVPAETPAAFFGFDSSKVPEANREKLAKIATLIQRNSPPKPVIVTGFTCDIGNAEYNLKLSKRRAKKVTDFLVSHGVPSAQITTQGKGEAEPKYPNTPSERHLNRRVDIQYSVKVARQESFTPMQATQTPQHAKASASTPIVAAQPNWASRALFTPLPHQRQVNTYTQRQIERKDETTRKSILDNKPPVAVDDQYYVPGNKPSTLDVLENDSDPDGNPLEITNFTQPKHGQLELVEGKLKFTPYGIFQVDFFSYTISDGLGGTSTGNVTLIDP